MLHELIKGDVLIVDLRADSVDYLTEIVWRDIGGHSDRDAGSPVDKEIWKSGWKNCRFRARFIVIRDKVHRVLVHIGHECCAQMRHARFGVTHGRRWIAFD